MRSSLAPLVVVLVALAAYANAWPDALVHDDKFCRGSERFVALSNIPRYFTEKTWATSGGDSKLYRPLLLTSITLDSRIHGDWTAGYHLTNLALHALVSLLVFVFLRQLLSRMQGPTRADVPVALAVALVFAVHPVHTEVVNSIFNRSEMLAALGALAGLTWFLRYLDSKPAQAWAGLGLAYLAAMLSRESAVALPGIAVTLVLAITPGSLAGRVRKCLPAVSLLLPLLLYGVLRVAALAPDTIYDSSTPAPDTIAEEPEHAPDEFADWAELLHSNAREIGLDIPGGKRFFLVFGFWYEGLRVLVLPYPLSIAPTAISGSAPFAGLALTLALFSFAAYLAIRRRYGLLVGLAIFYIASLPASHLIAGSWMPIELSERYLYFPSIGLAVAAVFALRYLFLRISPRVVAGATLAVLTLCLPLTWARNSEWASDLQLYESDYHRGNYDRDLLVWLTAAYLVQSDYDKAAEICDRHEGVRNASPVLSSHCGIAYGHLGRFREAEAAHRYAASQPMAGPLTHANLAYFYLTQGRWKDAKAQFERAVKKERVPATRAVRRGEMLAQLYQWDRDRLLEARAQFKKALKLQPSMKQAQEGLTRVDQMLANQSIEQAPSTGENM